MPPLTVALLSLPFYDPDPERFGPLEAATRLQWFDERVPYGGVLVGASMIALRGSER